MAAMLIMSMRRTTTSPLFTKLINPNCKRPATVAASLSPTVPSSAPTKQIALSTPMAALSPEIPIHRDTHLYFHKSNLFFVKTCVLKVLAINNIWKIHFKYRRREYDSVLIKGEGRKESKYEEDTRTTYNASIELSSNSFQPEKIKAEFKNSRALQSLFLDLHFISQNKTESPILATTLLREKNMAELNRASKNRGLYVRMRLLHTTTKHHGRQTEKKTHCYRYLKWVLWFSLSSTYFLISSLITHHSPTTSLSKTATVSLSKTTLPSRALFESLNKTHLQKLKTHPALGLFNDLKVYIYDLPSKYNTDWLSNERCSNHLFASEVAIHRALLNSDVRTPDPNEADFFFVPIYVSCNFSSINGFPAIGHARSLIESAVRIISSELPFWNRSRGSDHVFVASHDFGACFHTMEEIAIEDGIPEVLKKSIILQTFGVKHGHPCQEVENVVIPAYVSPESVRPTIAKAPAKGRRDIFVFFRGKMEVHPKNISGRFYSKRVRTVIWQKYGGDRRFYLKRHRFAGYQSEIVRSVFCLCPLGWAPWSPRLVESVVLGCVPVIIADNIRLPFPSAVRWPEISLTVAENDIGKLGIILEHVAATNLSTIQRNLVDPTVRRALLFNGHMQHGDATWQVLDALFGKLDRSHRRSRLSGE